MEIYKVFRFEAAHFLPNVPPEHKCRNMHGHSYKLIVYLKGEINPETGWVMDFHVLKNIVSPVIDKLDHQVLNDVSGLENSTVENLAVWIWKSISPSLPILSKIVIEETATSGCVYSEN